MTDKRESTAINALRRTWKLLNSTRKNQIYLTLFASIIVSIFEAVSIGTIVPFLGVLTAPEKIPGKEYLTNIPFLDINGGSINLITFITISFCLTAIMSGVSRLALSYANIRLSMSIGSELYSTAFSRSLNQPYLVQASRNSSQILAGVEKSKTLVSGIIQPAITLASSFALIFSIFCILLIIESKLIALSLCVLGGSYFYLTRKIKATLVREGALLSTAAEKATRIAQEATSATREVILYRLGEMYATQFKNNFDQVQLSLARITIVSSTPKFVMETFGLVFTSLVATGLYVMNADMASVVPTLGAFAMGTQRLLPLAQQIYASYVLMTGSAHSACDALALIEQPIQTISSTTPHKEILFEKSIEIKNLSFKYSATGPEILRNLNFKIDKGSWIGIIGPTGSGKSTFVDTLIGLLVPSEGSILIDGRALVDDDWALWRAKIAYVPQNIYLTDESVAQNIAFGVSPDQIDMPLVMHVAKQAKIDESLKNWSDRFDTIVGERGVKFSGGQRQRIGLARALYRRAEVLVLDEATSALDGVTQGEVIDSLHNLGDNVTVILIAHRLSTLVHCDKIYELVDGEMRLTNPDPLLRAAS